MKTTTITEEEVRIIDKALETLFMQRSEVYHTNGEGKEELNEAEAVMLKLKTPLGIHYLKEYWERNGVKLK